MSMTRVTEEDLEELFNTISTWTKEEAAASVCKHLPQILSACSHAFVPENEIQVGRFITGTLLPLLSWDENALTLLTCSMKSTCFCLDTFIEKMEKEAQGEDYDCLYECISICLQSSKQGIEYAQSLESNTISLTDLYTLPFLEILCKVLDFAKARESSHNQLENVRTLLQECSEFIVIFTNLISLLHIDPQDPSSVDGVRYLYRSLSLIARKLSIVSELKASLKTWRYVMHLTQQYKETLMSSIDLTVPFECLLEEISEQYETLPRTHKHLDASSEVLAQRIVKVISFNIRAICAICDAFPSGASNAWKTVVKLLLLFTKHYSHGSFYKKYPKQIKRSLYEQENQALDAVLPNIIFLEPFVEFVQNIDPGIGEDMEPIESLLLLLHIIKFITVSSSPNLLDLWNPIILKKIVEILPKCYIELATPIMLPLTRDTQERVSLHNYVVIYSVKFLDILTQQQFQLAEKAIFKSLLSDNLYLTLFCSDVIVTIGRHATDQLVQGHISLILQLLQTENINTQTEYTLRILCKRLFSLLSNTIQDDVLKKLSIESTNEDNYVILLNLMQKTESRAIWDRKTRDVISLFSKPFEDLDDKEFETLGSFLKTSIVLVQQGKTQAENEGVKLVSEKATEIFLRIPTQFIKKDPVRDFWKLVLKYLTMSAKCLDEENFPSILQKIEQTTMDEGMDLSGALFVESILKNYRNHKSTSTDIIAGLVKKWTQSDEILLKVIGCSLYETAVSKREFKSALSQRAWPSLFQSSTDRNSLKDSNFLNHVRSVLKVCREKESMKNSSQKPHNLIQDSELIEYEKTNSFSSNRRKRKLSQVVDDSTVLKDVTTLISQLESSVDRILELPEIEQTIVSQICEKLENVTKKLQKK